MAERTRTLKVEHLARVEGSGSVTLRFRGDEVLDARLSIFEPPRFFEAFLRGRSHLEVPDITSRICGICPVAYLMSACHAIEASMGIRVEGTIRALRRLMYCGEWISSHTLHAFMLHTPDFLGHPDIVSLARDHPDRVKTGLRIKKLGNSLMAVMGGRSIHPINVRVGGFYRAPHRDDLRALLPELRWAREAVADSARWMSTFDFPHVELPYEFVALRHPSEYPFCEGRVTSSAGLSVEIAGYEHHFSEEQVPSSTALVTHGGGGGALLSGPLARFNLNFDRLRGTSRALAESLGLKLPVHNPYRSLLVRMVEVFEALEEAIAIIEVYEEPRTPFVDSSPRAATGAGATEAPRGLLYHRYSLDSDGTVLDARIMPPTSRNIGAMERDLFVTGPKLARLPQESAELEAERVVRNHDPCISCSTHFLKLRVERE